MRRRNDQKGKKPSPGKSKSPNGGKKSNKATRRYSKVYELNQEDNVAPEPSTSGIQSQPDNEKLDLRNKLNQKSNEKFQKDRIMDARNPIETERSNVVDLTESPEHQNPDSLNIDDDWEIPRELSRVYGVIKLKDFLKNTSIGSTEYLQTKMTDAMYQLMNLSTARELIERCPADKNKIREYYADLTTFKDWLNTLYVDTENLASEIATKNAENFHNGVQQMEYVSRYDHYQNAPENDPTFAGSNDDDNYRC